VADINAKPIDEWTAVHVATGTAAGALGMGFWTSMGLAAAYEVVEYAHEWPRGSKLFGSKRPESGVNVAVDLLVFAGGWWLGKKVRR
jgi:hypothetical protein